MPTECLIGHEVDEAEAKDGGTKYCKWGGCDVCGCLDLPGKSAEEGGGSGRCREREDINCFNPSSNLNSKRSPADNKDF